MNKPRMFYFEKENILHVVMSNEEEANSVELSPNITAELNEQGQYSIRVNDQWRVCFVWRDGDAYDVEIVDYH